eukprot:15352778-Ditylum_brightwellii.AAC.1
MNYCITPAQDAGADNDTTTGTNAAERLQRANLKSAKKKANTTSTQEEQIDHMIDAYMSQLLDPK